MSEFEDAKAILQKAIEDAPGLAISDEEVVRDWLAGAEMAFDACRRCHDISEEQLPYMAGTYWMSIGVAYQLYRAIKNITATRSPLQKPAQTPGG